MAEDWQHPFVNVFKHCDVEQKKDVEISGKVALRMDEIIHKKVFRIQGSIPAVNYIKLPKLKGLGLYGRFCYLQVKFEPAALFSIHLEVVTADGNVCRVSIGNIFKQENLKKKAGCVQFTLKDPPATWTLLSLDMAAAAAAVGPGASPYSCLKSLQLCSTLTVRGAFTSDIRFGLQTLPREMVMCHSVDPSQLEQLWLPAEPLGVPEPAINKPAKKSIRVAGRQQIMPCSDTQQHAAADQQAATPAGRVEAAQAAARQKPAAAAAAAAGKAAVASAAVAPPMKEWSSFSLTSEPSGTSTCSRAATSSGGAAAAGVVPAPPLLQPEPYMALQRINGYTGEYARSVLYSASTDELVFPAGSVVLAMAAGSTSSSSSGTKAATAAAGDGSSSAAAAVRCRPQGSQRYFLGHSAFVCCLALGGEGTLLATGQEGKQALIRVWDFLPQQQQQQQQEEGTGASEDDNVSCSDNNGTCLAILCAHAAHLAALDVSADGRALVAAGCDSQARQTIALWDISGLRQGRRAQLLVCQVSHHNVRVLRFSPFEPDHFMAAGRDNIRTYRLKGSELRGISVKLQPPLNKHGQIVGTAAAAIVTGPKIFTDIAYEASTAALQLPTQHVYVSTASGAVFQIDYAKRLLVAVYQLHVGSINSITIGDGLAATASDDATLRLWPLDFTTYLMEAEHEGPVTSACLTAGGLGVVAGCEDGVLGLLDVVSRAYTTLMRSHCGPVGCVVGHRERPEYCTTSSDGSVRIWDITRHQQLYEFGGAAGASGVPLCAAYHPQQYQLAVGFEKGLLRLFDVATTALLLEQQQHQGAVTQLLFTPDGSRLLTCGSDGKVVVCDASKTYAPIKVLLSTAPGSTNSSSGSGTVCAAASPDGQLIAVGQPAGKVISVVGGDGGGGAGGGSNGATVSLFAASSLEAAVCFETSAEGFIRLEFSPDGADLWALTSPPTSSKGESSSSSNCIMRFDTQNGTLLQVLPGPHGVSPTTAFTLDPAMRVVATGGADHLVKLWALDSREQLQQQQQQGGAGVPSLLPAYQSFTGHLGPVTGAAFLGTQLVTAGQDGNTIVWNISSAAAKAGQLQQRREPHPDLNVTMRSWLERPAAVVAVTTAGPTSLQVIGEDKQGSSSVPAAAAAPARRLAGSAAAVAGGVVVPELQAAMQDDDVEPSPLFSHAGQQQHSNRVAHNNAISAAAAAGAGATGPEQQVFAAPPVRCSALLGFNAAVTGGMLWLRQAGLLAHPAGNVMVLTDLATHKQQFLNHHTQPIGAVAASVDGQMLATAAAAPEAASGCADVCVWELSSRRLRCVLSQHPLGCQLLAFSPDGCWLVSIGGGLLVLWDLEAGAAAAIGKTHKAVTGVAWLPWRPLPQFLTCGGDGLLLWSLQPTFLEQRQLTVPDAAGVTFTAVATAASSGCLPHSSTAGQVLEPLDEEQARAEAGSTAFAADESGGIWQLAVGEGRLVACVKVAQMGPGETAAGLQWSQRSAALAAATSSGRLLRYTCSSDSNDTTAQPQSTNSFTSSRQWWAAASLHGAAAAGGASDAVPPQWQCDAAGSNIQLDGPITSLQLEPELLCEGVVASTAATCWYVDMLQQHQAPLLAGHAAHITRLVDAGGGVDGGVVASLCEDGWLALWQTSRATQMLPVAEFRSEQPASAVTFLPGCRGCVVGYRDGRMAFFDLTQTAAAAAAGVDGGGGGAACSPRGVGVIRWSVLRHASAVISLALHSSQPLVMAASRDGMITVTNTDSGRLVAACRDLTGTTTPLHDLAVRPAAAAALPADDNNSSSSSGCGASSAPAGAAAWLDRLLVFQAPWQANQAEVLASYQCPEVPEDLPPASSAVSFIPGSSSLLLFSSPCLRATALLFDYRAGQPLRTLALPGPPSSIAVSPAGQWLAFGLHDGRIIVVDSAGEGSSELDGWGVAGQQQQRAVKALTFTAGGRQLVSAAGGVMAVWDA